MKCTECNKIVWPWQRSKMDSSPGTIHLKCHRKLITSFMANSNLETVMETIREIREFESRFGDTGILSSSLAFKYLNNSRYKK